MAAENKNKAAEAEAPVNSGVEPAKKGKYVVAQEFRDIVDFSQVHKVGDDVSSMDASRLAKLVQGGLVEKK